MNSISPRELHRKIVAGEPLSLIDVRTAAEFQATHVPGAVLEPLDCLDPCRISQQLAPNRPLYVLCQSGTRARQAIRRFEQSGVGACVLVEGGTAAWLAAGLPVERQPGRSISLDRQVRIALGTLVLLGCMLAILWNRLFLGLPVFIGAGLVFAGITDTCGVGMLLARMPWNRRQTGACGCQSR